MTPGGTGIAHIFGNTSVNELKCPIQWNDGTDGGPVIGTYTFDYTSLSCAVSIGHFSGNACETLGSVTGGFTGAGSGFEAKWGPYGPYVV